MSWELAAASAAVAVPSGIVGGVAGGITGGVVGGITGVATNNREFGKKVTHILIQADIFGLITGGNENSE